MRFELFAEQDLQYNIYEEVVSMIATHRNYKDVYSVFLILNWSFAFPREYGTAGPGANRIMRTIPRPGRDHHVAATGQARRAGRGAIPAHPDSTLHARIKGKFVYIVGSKKSGVGGAVRSKKVAAPRVIGYTLDRGLRGQHGRSPGPPGLLGLTGVLHFQGSMAPSGPAPIGSANPYHGPGGSIMLPPPTWHVGLVGGQSPHTRTPHCLHESRENLCTLSGVKKVVLGAPSGPKK